MRVIFKCKVGSNMFGTATETSDVDIVSIVKYETDDLLGLNYEGEIQHSPDDKSYELGKFFDLLIKGNPNLLEVLNCPEDSILETSDEWEYLKKHKDVFITKNLYSTFVQYAKTQISKSKGLNKKINWEKSKTERKTVLDFCQVLPYESNQSIPLKKWLAKEDYKQEYCGLAGIEHFKNCYLLYVDELEWVKNEANHRFDNIETHKYKGVVQDEENSNDVSTSSIPKYCIPKGVLFFNREAYSSHCKDYREYIAWTNKRNEDRFQTNEKHGQDYDGKNLAHTWRLLNSAETIAKEGKINVRLNEEQRNKFLSIKSGQEDLSKIVQWAEIKASELEELFKNSSIADSPNIEECNKLLIHLRKM